MTGWPTTCLTFSYGPAEHTSVTGYVVFTHTFDHSLVQSFDHSLISVIQSVKQKVGHNTHQPVLRNVRFEVLIVINMKIYVF